MMGKCVYAFTRHRPHKTAHIRTAEEPTDTHHIKLYTFSYSAHKSTHKHIYTLYSAFSVVT